MIRRVGNIVSALSLVSCIAAILIWARSYAANQSIEIAYKGQLYEISVSHGVLTIDNAPQTRMEDALIKRLDLGITLATIRFSQLNAWLNQLAAEQMSRRDENLEQS